MEQGDGGMVDAVEHGGLDGRVVEHVLEDDMLAHGERMVKLPGGHEVAAEAGATAEPIDMVAGGVGLHHAGATHGGMVGHLQAVGHVAGETHVEHGGADAAVLDNIDDLAHQGTGLPAKGAAGLQDDAEPGIAGVETAEQGHQRIDVVVGTGHEVAAAEIDPLDLGKPFGKMVFYMYERAREDIGTALAMAMAMEALDVGGQLIGQLLGTDAEAGARRAGIVEERLDLGVARIDAQAEAQAGMGREHGAVVARVLGEGVEGDVGREARDLGGLVVGESGREGVDRRAKVLVAQAGLVERGGRRGVDILAEDGERLPQRKGLEGQNDLNISLVGHTLDKGKIAAQTGLLQHVNGLVNLGKSLFIHFHAAKVAKKDCKCHTFFLILQRK